MALSECSCQQHSGNSCCVLNLRTWRERVWCRQAYHMCKVYCRGSQSPWFHPKPELLVALLEEILNTNWFIVVRWWWMVVNDRFPVHLDLGANWTLPASLVKWLHLFLCGFALLLSRDVLVRQAIKKLSLDWQPFPECSFSSDCRKIAVSCFLSHTCRLAVGPVFGILLGFIVYLTGNTVLLEN